MPNSELVLMIRDNCVRHQDGESSANEVHVIKQIVEPMDQLELDEQHSHHCHDHDMGQLNDDILYEENVRTENIIQALNSLNCKDSDDGSDVCEGYFYQHNDDSSEDDLTENTDTDDDIEELVNVIGGNTKLIAFLQKQRATIFRLRKRIVRMHSMLADAGLVERIHGILDTLCAHLFCPPIKVVRYTGGSTKR
jgi:hypothetical protein